MNVHSRSVLLGNSGDSQRRSQKRRVRAPLALEQLDSRRMLTTTAVLDFTGGTVTSTQMEEGGWAGYSRKTISSFSSLFTSSRLGLDIDSNGLVDSTDADLAISQIIAKVRTHYAPFDISITAGDHSAYHDGLMDGNRGDVIVMVSGGDDVISPTDPAFGWAPLDEGNQDDEYAFTFGKEYYYAGYRGAEFINAVSRTISHEMAHTFGLEHVEGSDAHHLMSLPPARDYGHYFNFPDYVATTESGTTQNAHEYLTQTLGGSLSPWAAVLRPGTLTIQGSDRSETLAVYIRAEGNWDVAAGSRRYYVDPDVSPDINSLNPYVGTAINSVVINGGGGHDLITATGVSSAVMVYAYGGSGNDTIFGHGGRDYLRGDSGHDILLGLLGNDDLYGDSGRDLLFGGAGDDNLDGGTHDDMLFGVDSTIESSFTKLSQLRSTWFSSENYSTRVANAYSILATTTETNDGAVDRLFGSDGLDLFLYGLADVLDATSTETKRRFS